MVVTHEAEDVQFARKAMGILPEHSRSMLLISEAFGTRVAEARMPTTSCLGYGRPILKRHVSKSDGVEVYHEQNLEPITNLRQSYF
jgi:hypothetical protein